MANEMRGTRGLGECYIAKHSRECHQTFKGTLLNIPGNAAKHSGEYPQTFRGMLPNLPGANIFGVNKENY